LTAFWLLPSAIQAMGIVRDNHFFLLQSVLILVKKIQLTIQKIVVKTNKLQYQVP
jgi:hypothetical protein